MGWLLVACGVFAIYGAALQVDWFMNHPKARFLIRLLGWEGARIFYYVLGTALILLGALLITGRADSS